ncbi:bifunctional molybdenum cofactor biosynthesis protein MoaC/MoaB [Candidatus Chrysopegis kryptomonas]|uniref:Molybdopterin adenylyltransferase n=1 Tax=Candidatus Chryseopegocella kryptomonas TaxID=1633643 RepID=A0A0P1MMT2_9BACT|nr:bifunctional molybdenum cofactor biosynthesis protein MoaC/MoaB [Candidatus Chrysopegis kryptomonas]CUS96783.1 molybdenum cofactor biosynthesis protein MoaC [Candidatus Chrysopegis kryptomonas]
MIDISNKIKTLRYAKAQAIVKMNPETQKAIENGKIEKGDVFEVSRSVAILSAKKVWEILPFCHNIPVEWVGVEFKFEGEGELRIEVEVKSTGKTGCEMEALFGVSAAALNVYDMIKPVDKSIEIKEIKLVEKRGGKSDYQEEIPEGFRAGVLVISDSISAGKKSDKSGRIIIERLKELGIKDIEYKIVPDELELIREQVLGWCDEGFDLVLTTGGTGLSPRDTTPEAIKPIIEKEIPGIMESSRSYGQERTPYAMLSRGVAGTKGKTLIITLPGSSRGVEESMNSLFPYVLHIYKMMQMKPHKE